MGSSLAAETAERSGITGELERARNMLGALQDKLKRVNSQIAGPRPETPQPSAPKTISRSIETNLQEIVDRINACHEEMVQMENSLGV